MAVKQYAKPAVRNAWCDDPPNGASDFVDPGNTFVDLGWPVGQKPPRQYDNWVLWYATASVRYFCQQGVSAWDAAEVYPSAGVTMGSDNRLYQSKVNNNAGINPVTDNGSNWGPVSGASPSNADNSNALTTTAWVNTNFLPKGASIQSLNGTLANAQLVAGNITQFQGSLAIGGGQITSTVGQANTLTAFGLGPMMFSWSAQSGQPLYVWGTNNGSNVFPVNPGNFSVSNSQQLQGLNPAIFASGTTIVARDANGNVYGSYLNQSSQNNENPSISQVLVTNGADNYLRKASLAALASALAGNQLLQNPGYARLPGGLIIQWAQVNAGDIPGNGTISATANFPIQFPTAILGIAPGSYDANGNLGSYVWNATTFNRSSISFGAHEVVSGVVQNVWFTYIVLGF